MIKKRAFVIFGRASVEIGGSGGREEGENMKKEGKQNKAQAEKKSTPTSPSEQNASSDLQPGQGQYFVSGGQW